MVRKWLKEQYADLKGHIKFAILAVLWAPLLAALKHVLRVIPNLPNWGAWAIILLISFVAFMLILHSIKTNGQSQQQTMQATSNTLMTSPVMFNAAEHFQHAYTSPLTADVEKNILVAATQNQPNDREGFLAKLIGIGLVSYTHDITWAYIFRSQILLLMELNKGKLLPLAEAKVFYDQAAQDYPERFKNYSFEQWLEFLKSRELLFHHPSDMLDITWRGKDYLKYSVHWGRYPDARTF